MPADGGRAVRTAANPRPSWVTASAVTVDLDGERYPRLKKLSKTVGLDLQGLPFGIVESADRDHRQLKPAATELALPDADDLTIDQQHRHACGAFVAATMTPPNQVLGRGWYHLIQWARAEDVGIVRRQQPDDRRRIARGRRLGCIRGEPTGQIVDARDRGAESADQIAGRPGLDPQPTREVIVGDRSVGGDVATYQLGEGLPPRQPPASGGTIDRGGRRWSLPPAAVRRQGARHTP